MKFITVHFRKRVGGSINSSVKFWQFKKMAPLKFGKKKIFDYTHFSFIILYNYNGCIKKHILKGKKRKCPHFKQYLQLMHWYTYFLKG